MRKLIVVASSLLLFSAGWCFGAGQAAPYTPGGTGWKTLSVQDHGLYVAGFLHGYLQGLIHGGSLVLEKASPEKVSSMSAYEKYELAVAHKITPVFLQGKDFSATELEPTIAVFYSDYRNMPVCFDDAIELSVASLAGNAATDQELDTARKRGAEMGCK
jgi:hypothetical protein